MDFVRYADSVRAKLHMGGASILVNFLILCLLAYQQIFTAGIPWWEFAGYGGFLVFLILRGRRFKARAADLLVAAARHAGLGRILKKGAQ